MATSIESKLSLALAVKLKALFEQPDKTDKFLCFPKGIAFTYDYLKCMLPPGQSGLDANVQHNNKCDFARIMNMSINDSLQFLPDASVFLWESFEQILKNSVFPETTLTEQEEVQLSEANKFLSIESLGENGFVTLVPSPAFNAYIHYKTLWDKANSIYLDEKITVENATGPEGEILKKKWSEYRDNQLLDLINQTSNDWVNWGYKYQIEKYTAEKKSLEQKKYANLVTNSYLNDLEQSDLPDLNANGLLAAKITFFSPNDISNNTVPWISIHLTKDEINSFVAQASPELKAAFNEGEGSDDIEAVSLEYNQVALIRTWFKHDYFASHYWKLPDNSIVSDGNIPRQGRIPAYISSMIVARNITITRKKSVGPQSTAPLIIPILSNFSVKNETPVSYHMVTGKQNFILKNGIRTFEAPLVIEGVNPKLATASFKSEATPLVSSSSVSPKLSTALFNPNVFSSMVHLTSENNIIEPTIATKKNYEHLKYIGTTISTPIIKIPINPQPEPSPQQTELITETYPFDGVFVLAYMCKRLPKSPDPDLTFKWP